MKNAKAKAILEYSPEYLPTESGDEQTFFIKDLGLTVLEEYDTECIGNLIRITKK